MHAVMTILMFLGVLLAVAAGADPVVDGTPALARLRHIQQLVTQGELAEAKVLCRALESDPGAPSHLRWEAGDRLREIERLSAGKPARDPAASRVRLPRAPRPAITLYVSPRGSDANPGTREHPFATLERARDALRMRGHTQGGAEVVVMSGTYVLRQAFQLDRQDSGTADAPVVYRAVRKGSARFTAGAALRDFRPVSDRAVLARLPEEARAHVMQVDLRAQGITDFGRLHPRGFNVAGGGCPALELYFNHEPLRLARWPNEGFALTGKVTDQGVVPEDHGGTFAYDGDRPSRWLHAPDGWLYGTWYYHWADATTGIAKIDPAARTISTAHPSGYGMREGQRWYAFNLLEELDQPGEWYLDRAAGMLYFYPPSDPNRAVVEISMLETPLVEMTGVSHVRLEGLTLEMGRWHGVAVSGGENCLLRGCTVRRCAGTGVVIAGGTGHGILGCDIHTVGRGGTVVIGGDRKTLTPGGHFVENCDIRDFSRIDRAYTPAVQMEGCGNRITHNLLHDSPHHAIRLEGNDILVEYNEIHSVVYESDDQAGLDIFLNPSYRGNVFRYNYWHHIGSGLDTNGQAGIRLDDAISGVLMYGNVFYRCSGGGFGGVQIHGGKENIVDNNLFVDCKYGVSFSPWGAKRWREFLSSEGIRHELQDVVDIRVPPYSTRYPTLARLLDQPDVNHVWRNVALNCGRFLYHDGGIEDLRDNLVTRTNPGLADPARADFTLKAAGPDLTGMAFRPIPFAEIGLYASPHRASWPVRNTITPHYHEGPARKP